MKKIAVFGSAGRAGQAITAEARKRGHTVTAVTRAQGDVTDPGAVAQVSAGHDVVVHAAASMTGGFFATAARALDQGLTGQRLIAVGLASVLATQDGELLMDSPEYPQEYRSFYEGHQEGLKVLQDTGIDWVMLSPAGDFDHSGHSTGGYRLVPAAADSRISYADFAIAVVDEIENPTYQRVHVGVEALS